MKAPTIQIEKGKAKEIYNEYLEAVKTRKEQYIKDLKQVYYHLSKGEKILDIYEVFKQSGVNEDGEPKLGIVRADASKCVFHKQSLGAGRFSESIDWRDKEIPARFDVILPSNTFPEWKTQEQSPDVENWDFHPIIRRNIQTKTPICPPHLLPEGKLDNYYILFEVDKWNEMPVAKDPFLLKRINSNAFIVLAEWELTEVEQAVIRGLQ